MECARNITFSYPELKQLLDNSDIVEDEGIRTEPIAELIPGNYYLNTWTGRVASLSSIHDKTVEYMYIVFGPCPASCDIEKFKEVFLHCLDVKQYPD